LKQSRSKLIFDFSDLYQDTYFISDRITMTTGSFPISFKVAGMMVLTSVCLCLTQGTMVFDRVRGLDPGRLPPAYLVLRLRVRVTYRNAGTRRMILPLERERTIYTSLKRGPMSVFHGTLGLLEPSYNVMKDLPADVSPDSPVTPRNDVFTVIPGGGEMAPALMEDIVLPVDRQALFRKYPDLRGHRVYLRLKFAHRELSTGVEGPVDGK
jgi:hypothetical protein